MKKWDFEKWQEVVFTDKVRMELESRRHVFFRRPVGKRNAAKCC